MDTAQKAIPFPQDGGERTDNQLRVVPKPDNQEYTGLNSENPNRLDLEPGHEVLVIAKVRNQNGPDQTPGGQTPLPENVINITDIPGFTSAGETPLPHPDVPTTETQNDTAPAGNKVLDSLLNQYLPIDTNQIRAEIRQLYNLGEADKIDPQVFMDHVNANRAAQIDSIQLSLGMYLRRSENYSLTNVDNAKYYFQEEAAKLPAEADDPTTKLMKEFYQISAENPEVGTLAIRAMLAQQLENIDTSDQNNPEIQRLQAVLEQWNQVDLGEEITSDEAALEANPDEISEFLTDDEVHDPNLLDATTEDVAVNALMQQLETQLDSSDTPEEAKSLIKTIMELLKTGGKGALVIATVMLIAVGLTIAMAGKVALS